MFFPRVFENFIAQHPQASANPKSCVVGHNNVVDKSPITGDKGIGEALTVFLGPGVDLVGIANILSKDDFDRAFWSHNGDLGARPS